MDRSSPTLEYGPRQLAGTRDNIEGVVALFAKRKPVFTGE